MDLIATRRVKNIWINSDTPAHHQNKVHLRYAIIKTTFINIDGYNLKRYTGADLGVSRKVYLFIYWSIRTYQQHRLKGSVYN